MALYFALKSYGKASKSVNGFVGPQGPKGDTGAPGKDGSNGATGPSGTIPTGDLNVTGNITATGNITTGSGTITCGTLQATLISVGRYKSR